VIDMPAVLAEAKQAGVEWPVVEQDSNWHGSPVASARQSLDALRRLLKDTAALRQGKQRDKA